jgi:hypothetical protein
MMWIEFLDEGIPLLLLTALALALYRGFRKNHALLAEREDLLRRYLIFRGNRQLEEDQKAQQELLKTFSNSWKNFKKTYDEYLASLNQNTTRTKFFILIITLGLLTNSSRLLLREFYFVNARADFLLTMVRDLSSYVLVVFSFFLLRTQTHHLLLSKGNIARMDREILFFPNGLSEEETEGLYDQFDPIEMKGAQDEQEDQDHDWGTESGSRAQ